MLKKMTTLEVTFVVLMAACGIALKPIVAPMGKILGTALFIPGGTVTGIIYMLWPMLALLVVRNFGTAAFVGLIEGAIVLITGFYGSHGILSLLIYVLPCLAIDLTFWLFKNMKSQIFLYLPAAVGNLVGAAIVGVFIMRIPSLPLLISLGPAFIFGGMGGWLAYSLYSQLIKSFPQFAK